MPYNNVERLHEDHLKASSLGECLQKLNWVERVLPCETNILIFFVASTAQRDAVLNHLKDNSIFAMAFGPQSIRFVTHLDFTNTMLEQTIACLKAFKA